MENNRDDLYAAAVKLVRSLEHPTASSIQRHFRIGYGHAMKLVHEIKERGDWPRAKQQKELFQ